MKLCELRKEPYTMAELYKIVEEKLKKDGNWPDDIIDYTLVVNQNIEVLDNAFVLFHRYSTAHAREYSSMSISSAQDLQILRPIKYDYVQ